MCKRCDADTIVGDACLNLCVKNVPHNPVLNTGTTWKRRWTTYVAYEIRNAVGPKRWLVS